MTELTVKDGWEKIRREDNLNITLPSLAESEVNLLKKIWTLVEPNEVKALKVYVSVLYIVMVMQCELQTYIGESRVMQISGQICRQTYMGKNADMQTSLYGGKWGNAEKRSGQVSVLAKLRLAKEFYFANCFVYQQIKIRQNTAFLDFEIIIAIIFTHF